MSPLTAVSGRGGAADAQASGLTLMRSTYARRNLNDRVINIAARRMGSPIEGALVAVDSDVFLSSPAKDRIDGLRSLRVERHARHLSSIARYDPADDEPEVESGSDLDFQILRLVPETPGVGVSTKLSLYKFFQRDMPSVDFVHVAYTNDEHLQMRTDYLKHEVAGFNMMMAGSHFITSPEKMRMRLSMAEALALTVEAWMMEGNSYTDEADEILARLWEGLSSARPSLLAGRGFPTGFETCMSSLKDFLNRL